MQCSHHHNLRRSPLSHLLGRCGRTYQTARLSHILRHGPPGSPTMHRPHWLGSLFRPRPLLFGTQSPPRFVFSTLKVVLITHLVWEHLISVAECSGPSMVPTLPVDGNFLLYSKLHRRGRGCKVGDLVSSIHPQDSSVYVLKRIIGMPGDFICVDPGGGRRRMIQVPEGHCWLAGDNINMSRDSREYGPVPLGLIRAKAIARIWPNPGFFKNGLLPAQEEYL